jgi:hypothetical protein
MECAFREKSMFRSLVAFAWVCVSVNPAFGQSYQPDSYIDLLDRYGMDVVGEFQPLIVDLSTTGNNCPATRTRHLIIATSLEGQLEDALCTLEILMVEAAVSPTEIVEARFLVRTQADADNVRRLLESRRGLGDTHWDIRLAANLPISNDAVRLSLRIIALSPESDDALRQLGR